MNNDIRLYENKYDTKKSKKYLKLIKDYLDEK